MESNACQIQGGGLKRAGFKGVEKKTSHGNPRIYALSSLRRENPTGGPCFSLLSMSTEPL